MFNVYAFEKKVMADEKSKLKEDKDKRVMSTHRRMRDILAENYQKRVAMFIREMVDSPVKHNDEYSMRLTLNTSKASDASDQSSTKASNRAHNTRYQGHRVTKSTSNDFQAPLNYFRYSNYRTEKDRIKANIKSNLEFCDSVPSPDKSQFQKSLRARQESKEIGPQFRFTAKSGVERVFDQLHSRITSAFEARELADDKLRESIKKQRKFNQTITPKQLLPNIHNKTHFKAVTSIYRIRCCSVTSLYLVLTCLAPVSLAKS